MNHSRPAQSIKNAKLLMDGFIQQHPAYLACTRAEAHLVKTFNVSRDKNFAAKVADVVGLYLNPPDKSLVLCIDEKSQIQALDRTQPGLPLKKGRCGTFTHDYVRHGTTSLFAALEILEGKFREGQQIKVETAGERLTFAAA